MAILRAVAGRKKLKILAISLGVVVVGLSAAAWSMWPSVEDIPEELPEISEEVSIADLTLAAQGPLEAVRLGDLQGKTVYLMIEGQESMMGGEGKLLRRALHRWTLPEDVVGFSVGDAPGGMALMRNKIETEFLGPMRAEMKLPIYVDFGGSFTSAFSLPKGHLGFVILDAEGEIVFRHAGDPGPEEIEQIKGLLRAQEPEPGPPAPSFEVGEFSNQSCAGKSCVLVFLDQKVVRSDIPGLEDGGFEGEMKQTFEQIKKPSIRLASMVAGDWGTQPRSNLAGVVVGDAEGWSGEGWSFVSDAADARAAFGIGDVAAMIIVDEQGRLAFSEQGLIPFWKLSLAADLLGIEPKPRGRRGEK